MSHPFFPLFCAFALCARVSAAEVTLEPADRQEQPVIAPASSEATLALQQIKAPEGLDVSLWAAEPLLAHPVAIDFDEHGRLFVAETHRVGTSVLDVRGYPDMLERDLASRTVEDRAEMIKDLFGEQAPLFAIEDDLIRRVVDTDGDGVADSSSIYADGFNDAVAGVAAGVLARQGSVYFTNIPHLWRLEGLDEEGQATSRKSVHSGFGVHFGFGGHDLHGLTLGPDGKLYFSIGDRGANVVNHEGERLYVPDEGSVFRCNLDGSDLEVVHSGLRNPQELAFDEMGNLFTGDNDCDNGDFERLVLLVEGGDSGWRIGHQYSTQGSGGVWIEEGWWKERFEGQAMFLLPPLFYLNDGPSGIAYYPGTGLSPEYQGHLFITHFKGNVTSSSIDTYTLEPDGASFKLGERKPFLTNILPTDVTFAPDGRLYVSDWVSGWGKSGKGRIYAVAHAATQQSELVQQTEQLIAAGMSGRSEEDLFELLAHPNWNVRLEAQFELAARGAASEAGLAALARDESQHLHPRLHAIWALGQLAGQGVHSAKERLLEIARSVEGEPRAQAVKLLGDHQAVGAGSLLVSYLQDSSARVRFFAAQSLGKLKLPEAAPALIDLARQNDDRDLYLRHAILMGLLGSNNPAALEQAAGDESKAVRTVVLLAYRRLKDKRVAQFLHDAEPELALEAARAINDEGISEAFPALAAALDHPLAENPVLGHRALNAHFRLGLASNARAVARYAANQQASEKLRLEALRYLTGWAQPHPRDRIIGQYRPLPERPVSIARDPLIEVAPDLLQGAPAEIQTATIEALAALEITQFAENLRALVQDETQADAARVAAFNALASQKDPQLDQLVSYASQSQASGLRLATLPLVAQGDPEAAQASLSLMIEGSVEERRAAYAALAATDKPFAVDLLARSLRQLIAGEVPYAAQLELIETIEDSAHSDLQELYADYLAQIAADPDPVAPYRFALEGGGGGWGVFNQNNLMACVRCHVAHGPGESAGPNLRSIGFKDRRYLLEAIVAPSATIAPGFETTILTLDNGQTRIGVLQAEDETSYTLRMGDGSEETFKKSIVADRTRTPSTMPDIYKDGLTRHELRDVVEYLSNLRENPEDDARTTHSPQ